MAYLFSTVPVLTVVSYPFCCSSVSVTWTARLESFSKTPVFNHIFLLCPLGSLKQVVSYQRSLIFCLPDWIFEISYQCSHSLSCTAFSIAEGGTFWVFLAFYIHILPKEVFSKYIFYPRQNFYMWQNWTRSSSSGEPAILVGKSLVQSQAALRIASNKWYCTKIYTVWSCKYPTLFASL